jgi:ankyrin repeat protein
MASLCIGYLISEWNENWTPSRSRKTDEVAPQQLRMEHPFLDYALHYWDHHLAKLEEADGSLFAQLDTLMESKSKVFLSFLDLMGFDDHPDKICALHIASAKDLHQCVTHLLQNGQEPNATTLGLRTPLHFAAEAGHFEVVQMLLNHGAASDMANYQGLKPIHLAASRDHHLVVKTLLESVVDPMTPKRREYPGRRCGSSISSIGTIALQFACRSGHTKTVTEFIPFLDVEGLSKALFWAAASGTTDMVLAILRSPIVDINKRVEGTTPLYLASRS